MAKQSKMMEGIKVALELIDNGVYEIIDSSLYRGERKLGSKDKQSGNIFYVIKGVDILAQRLHYAYHNGGVDSLKEGYGIHFLDGNRENLTKDNLVQLPRKGAKAKLTELRKGLSSPLPITPQEVPTNNGIQAEEDTTYTAKELEARKIMQLVNKGLSNKEVAEQLGVKASRVNDVKRGKSNAKATADLRK